MSLDWILPEMRKCHIRQSCLLSSERLRNALDWESQFTLEKRDAPRTCDQLWSCLAQIVLVTEPRLVRIQISWSFLPTRESASKCAR